MQTENLTQPNKHLSVTANMYLLVYKRLLATSVSTHFAPTRLLVQKFPLIFQTGLLHLSNEFQTCL